jgi:hypothetical protein
MTLYHDDGGVAAGLFAGVSAMKMLMVCGLIALALILGVPWQPWVSHDGETGNGAESPAPYHLDVSPQFST